MIISHRHQLIFLHCRKSAGSSVTVSIARLLGPHDLQIGCVQDAVHFGIFPPLHTIRASLWPPQAKPWSELWRHRSLAAWLDAQIKAHFVPWLGPKPQHAPASLVAQAFPHAWSHYRRFCVVRNPWSKTLSDFRWRTQGLPNPPSFDAYLCALRDGDRLGGVVPHNHDNWSIYSLSGRIAVDHVVRFEHLAADLSALLRSLGVPWDGWLPHAKAFSGLDPLAYRAAYSPSMAAIVSRLYEHEIQQHGYTF